MVASTSGCIVVWTPDGCPGCTGDEARGDIDSDGDGLRDEDEDAIGTDPLAFDSDGDGDSDGAEDGCAADPLDPGESCADVTDSDDDGRSDAQEQDRGTNPLDPDTDDDGWDDGEEDACSSSPMDPQFTCEPPEQQDGATLCWWIGDLIALGQTCTLYTSNIYIEEMSAEGCVGIDASDTAYIVCRSEGNETCTCEAQAGDDVVVDESGCG